MPVLNFGLKLGPQWLTYQGAEIDPALGSPKVDHNAYELAKWHDEDRNLYVNWNAEKELFRAYLNKPESPVEFGFSDPRNAVHSLIERPDLMPAFDEGGGASALICRSTVGAVAMDTRTGFFAPAPAGIGGDRPIGESR